MFPYSGDSGTAHESRWGKGGAQVFRHRMGLWIALIALIVAAGGGVGNRENFRLIEELAEVLGGTIGASRVPVDEGWVLFDKQIGQTGKTVEPSLYMACGISGTIYHTMGMKDSKVIVAINKDRNAPIFKLADMGIVGDLLEVVPAIASLLRERSTHAKEV